jgi:hypothetical protein
MSSSYFHSSIHITWYVKYDVKCPSPRIVRMFACLRPVRGVFRLILAVEVLSIAYRNPVWTSFALSGVRGGIVHGTHSTLQGLTARALHASVHNPTPAESGFTSRRELASLLAAAGVFVGAHSDAANAGFFDIKPKKFYDPKGRYALEYPGDWKVLHKESHLYVCMHACMPGVGTLVQACGCACAMEVMPVGA